MAIQEVWLHGRGCDCDDCNIPAYDQVLVTANRGENSSHIIISSELNTVIQDQYGQRYIITPIPDVE